MFCSDDDMTSSQGSVCTVIAAGPSHQMQDIPEEPEELPPSDEEMLESKAESASESDDEDNPQLKW